MIRLKQEYKVGRVVTNGVKLEPHEYETVLFLAGMGKDIELLQRSQTPNKKEADFCMDSLIWEAKSPVVNERRALERLFYRASTQSSNLVFDLRRLRGKDEMAVRIVEDCFRTTRRVRNMYIITKNSDLREHKKK